eukprot:47324-Eustigmatos_ZCMA.PRE.1
MQMLSFHTTWISQNYSLTRFKQTSNALSVISHARIPRSSVQCDPHQPGVKPAGRPCERVFDCWTVLHVRVSDLPCLRNLGQEAAEFR